MSERLYIEIVDIDGHRTVSVPRHGAIVVESSVVRAGEQVPYVTIRYGCGATVHVEGVTRRDVVDALESGVGILNGAWTVAPPGIDDSFIEQARALTDMLGGARPDLPPRAGLRGMSRTRRK